jgi:hypothetical protein
MNISLPQFPTAELLYAVPRLSPDSLFGVSSEVFKQWVARGHVVLSSADTSGKGRPTLHTAADVVQVAFIRRLTTQGLSPGLAGIVWQKIRGLLDDWRNGMPNADRLVLFHFNYSGDLHWLVVPEAGFSIAQMAKADRREEAHSDWSDAQFMIRFDHFVRHVIARLQIIIDTRDERTIRLD